MRYEIVTGNREALAKMLRREENGKFVDVIVVPAKYSDMVRKVVSAANGYRRLLDGKSIKWYDFYREAGSLKDVGRARAEALAARFFGLWANYQTAHYVLEKVIDRLSSNEWTKDQRIPWLDRWVHEHNQNATSHPALTSDFKQYNDPMGNPPRSAEASAPYMTALYGHSFKEGQPTDNSESRDGRFSLLDKLVNLEFEILDAIMEGKLDPIKHGVEYSSDEPEDERILDAATLETFRLLREGEYKEIYVDQGGPEDAEGEPEEKKPKTKVIRRERKGGKRGGGKRQRTRSTPPASRKKYKSSSTVDSDADDDKEKGRAQAEKEVKSMASRSKGEEDRAGAKDYQGRGSTPPRENAPDEHVLAVGENANFTQAAIINDAASTDDVIECKKTLRSLDPLSDDQKTILMNMPLKFVRPAYKLFVEKDVTKELSLDAFFQLLCNENFENLAKEELASICRTINVMQIVDYLRSMPVEYVAFFFNLWRAKGMQSPMCTEDVEEDVSFDSDEGKIFGDLVAAMRKRKKEWPTTLADLLPGETQEGTPETSHPEPLNVNSDLGREKAAGEREKGVRSEQESGKGVDADGNFDKQSPDGAVGAGSHERRLRRRRMRNASEGPTMVNATKKAKKEGPQKAKKQVSTADEGEKQVEMNMFMRGAEY
ncbi:hypothetical protein C8Q80DRAFT_1276444 [Daedaleopsis nitida]|nr:hypothetical protein C8Q80DRAFT_1276444 [Daedaleopsis nitida]